MVESKPQPSLAAAAAGLFWTWAFAAARVADAFAARGMKLWSQMLSPPRGVPLLPMPPGLSASPRHRLPTMDPDRAPQPPAPAEPPVEPAFASYRSSGGHASAQVVVPGKPCEEGMAAGAAGTGPERRPARSG
jgi:hypothetical protein